MYRVLIADDEDIIRTGLANMIRRRRPEFIIVAECSNGEEVIECLKTTPVDIVVTDICMPFKTGLDIAKYVYEKKLPVQMLIISGYEEFEYAKMAIKYKVNSFLTKPLDTTEILNQLDTCVENIDKFRDEATQQAINYVNNFEFFKDKFFALLRGNIDYMSFYNFALRQTDDFYILDFPFVGFVCFENEDGIFTDTEFTQIKPLCENASITYLSFFYKQYENKFECLIFYHSYDCVNFFAEEIIRAMGLFYSKKIKFSIEKYNGIKHFVARILAENDAENYFNAVFNKNYEIIEKTYERISSVNDKEYNSYYCDAFLKKIGEYCIIDKKYFLSINEILDYCRDAIERSKSLVHDMQKFIQDNIINNITVFTVAEHFKLTPGYVGKIYKKETGKKLIDYILEVKMEKAKELLKKGGIKVEDIATLLGYSQPLNFRKQFKRFTGYTPSEFIRRK